MASTENSGLGHGSNGSPQSSMEEQIYPAKAEANETVSNPPRYVPSPKHEPGHGWGSANPIQSLAEGQHLLDTGYHNGKQVYNITSEGKLVKFQPEVMSSIFRTFDEGVPRVSAQLPLDFPS